MDRKKAADVQRAKDRLLQVLGRVSNYRVHERWVTVGELLDEDPKLRRMYELDGGLNVDALWDELWLLDGARGSGAVDFTPLTGPPNPHGDRAKGEAKTWTLKLRPEGLDQLVEIEKCWLRRAYEKNPPAWWMVGLAFASLPISIVALLKSFGVFG